jgi:hypothetical protein
MNSRSSVPIPRLRDGLLVAALLAVGALHVQTAVLPLSYEPLGDSGGRAGLLAEPLAALSGEWTGLTDSGRPVSLVLRVAGDGGVTGDAVLKGVVADAGAGPRPLVTPTVSGQTLAFAVQPGPCAKSLTHGVVTFVTRQSARLDLLAGQGSISVRLQKVG